MSRKNSFPLVMKTLALASGLGCLFLFWANGWSKGGLPGALAITMLTCFYHLAMRLAVGAAVPNRWNPQSRWFRPKPWEGKLYKNLGVRRWKRLVPTYDPDSFNLEKHSPQEVLQVMCRNEAVHWCIVVLSLLPIGFSFVFGETAVFVCTSLASAGMDTVFVLLQRYNRPRVEKLLERGARKA